MVRISKRKREFLKLIEEDGENPAKKGSPAFEKSYTLEQAIAKVERFPKVKFDETIEIHVHLNIDSKAPEQSVRGTVILPHGTGKKIKVAVFCKGELAQKAEEAGADFVGANDLIEKVAKGFMDFDTVIATPDMMRDLSKLGKVLGPRGLMPSPKAGTVTNDLERVIKEVKAGRVEFKSDKQCGVHVGIGKRSFTKEQLKANAIRLFEALNSVKPPSVKGGLIKSVFLSTTMGPGLKLTES